MSTIQVIGAAVLIMAVVGGYWLAAWDYGI